MPGYNVAIPEKVPYDELIQKVVAPHGANWRSLPPRERDGAWGVAMVRSVLDGVRPSLTELSSHLGVPITFLRRAYNQLSLNGVFRNDRIHRDHALKDWMEDKNTKNDSMKLLPWCFYAAYASGDVGHSKND